MQCSLTFLNCTYTYLDHLKGFFFIFEYKNKSTFLNIEYNIFENKNILTTGLSLLRATLANRRSGFSISKNIIMFTL